MFITGSRHVGGQLYYYKMVFTCCIVGCTNRSGRDKGVSFYHIPAIILNQGKQTAELSSKRQLQWIASINRKDWVPSGNSRVCSAHFISGILLLYDSTYYDDIKGKPAPLYESSSPDWVPSLMLTLGYHSPTMMSTQSSVERFARFQSRSKRRRLSSQCEGQVAIVDEAGG